MKLTETTPKTARTFTLEFNEDELKMLGAIFAVRRESDDEIDWKQSSREWKGKLVPKFGHHLYSIIDDLLEK